MRSEEQIRDLIKLSQWQLHELELTEVQESETIGFRNALRWVLEE